MSKIKPFNFIAECVSDFNIVINDLQNNNFRDEYEIEFLDRLLYAKELLLNSTKFIIPNGNELLGITNNEKVEIDKLYFDNKDFHLPYPIITLEYTLDITSANEDDFITDMECVERIALATEIIIDNKRYISILPFWKQFIPKYNRKMWILNYATTAIDENSFDYTQLKFPKVQEFMPKFFNKLRDELGEQKFIKYTINDLFDETIAVAKFIQALSCSNIIEESVSLSKLKQSRNKKKNIPHFDYKVLKLDPSKKRKYSRLNTSNNKRKSPRFHLRRGHIRNTVSGPIWIPWMTVGDVKNGVIIKDYLWG